MKLKDLIIKNISSITSMGYGEMKLNPFTLSFPGDVEKDFYDVYFNKSVTHVRLSIIFGIFFYSIFGLLDYFLIPEKTTQMWTIRFGLFMPAAVAVLFFSFTRYFKRYMQLLLFILLTMAGTGIVMMIVIAKPPVTYSYYAGLILVFLMGYTFVKARFIWASLSGWLIVICYEVVAIWVSDTPVSVLLNNNFFFISANLMGMLACYSIEYYARRDFFLVNLLQEEQDKVKKANSELEKKVEERTAQLVKTNEDLNKAYTKISVSEEKYKLLVEGSSEIIFSLDQEWNFITVNNAIKKHLRISADSVKSMNFFDIIHDEDSTDCITKQLIKEKLELFSKTRQPVDFKTEFKSSINAEPKEMRVRMEYINIEGKNEILGRADYLTEDVLLKHSIYEKQKYVIGNYLLTAEEITHLLTRNLRKYLDAKETTPIRIALREIIINAIEHGNLNISYEEKNEALITDNYFDLISRRQNDPVNTSKNVFIEYLIDSDKVIYKITDEGKGFDHFKMMNIDSGNADEEIRPHGRGIMLARSIFDQITYNKKGNQALLIKNFK